MSRRGSNVLQQMFSDAETPAERARALEAYKAAITKSISNARSGKTRFSRGSRTIAATNFANPERVEALFGALTKSLGADQAASLGAELAELRQYVATDIQKDWTPTNPVGGTGLTPYDLVGPAEVLVPHDTPIRNSTPRAQGQGNARKFKRIDSFTNAGIPGGAGVLSPFFSSASATSTWNGLTLNRPPKISYTGSDHSVGYVELGFSDQVDYLAMFEALGFDDLTALSHTALLWSHLLGEERAMLYARGSGTGYEGAIVAPTGVTGVGASTGGGIGAATYYVYVTAVGGWGESVISTVATTGALSGSTNTITVSWTEPVGAFSYNVYIGTTTGGPNTTLQTNVLGSNTVTLTAYTTSGPVPPTSDSTASSLSYDGNLTVLADPTISGYVKRVNGNFSTTNPGVEFDTALTQMWTNNDADPEEIWMTGALRTELNQLMRIGGTNGASSGYRTNVETGDNGVTMSTTVTGYVNPASGRVVDIHAHRFQPNGTVWFRSTSIPIQDSHVPAPSVAVNVQDYMAIDWPDIQMSKDTSTYQVGTLVHHAPAWSGMLIGVK
jgi:hypothetical protein